MDFLYYLMITITVMGVAWVFRLSDFRRQKQGKTMRFHSVNTFAHIAVAFLFMAQFLERSVLKSFYAAKSRDLALILAACSLIASISLYATELVNPRPSEPPLAKQHGCKETVKYPHTDKLRGTDLQALRSSALRSGTLKQLYLSQHRELGETWEEIGEGGVRRINTVSQANFRHVYASGSAAFHKTGGLNRASRQLFGDGILTSEGEEWAWHRKLIVPTFSKYERGTMPMLEAHVDRFMANLPRDGRAFDVQPLLKRLHLDLASDFLFGEPLGMQLPERQAEARDFLATLDSALLGLNKRRQDFTLSSIKLWFDNSYSRDVAKVHAFIDDRVKGALLRTSVVSPELADKKRPNSSRYILVDEMAKHVRDLVRLRFALLQCFAPGRDQPAILMANTLFELSRHPSHWAGLRSLALELSTSDLLSFPVLASLNPVRNVIYEALRLHGPGGFHRRFAIQDVVLPEGGGPDGESPVFLPAGTQVQTHLPVMHRSKTTWGEDADEFRPERFKDWKEGSWDYRPFLAGPRICPAKDQAMVQATYVLVRLLREFEAIECADECREFIEMVRLTTESRNGAKIRLVPTNV